jgi:DNA-binding response OmpR family regulator
MNRTVPKILCVDDEPMNLILLDAMLSPCGYEIVQASCGAEALELMKTERFDLCLLDVMMPGIDGFEVCRRIKAAGAQRQIPVVLLTAYSSKEHRVRGIEAGAEDFLCKPLDAAEVLARVKMLLQVQESAQLTRRQEEKEKSKLEEQLQHAQKLESVALLASGVAHDFNNMLCVIIGHATMALRGAGPGQTSRANLEQILKAAEKSAELTRQLLRFASRQSVEPQVANLNLLTAGTFKMLQRLIGEEIDLAWKPGQDLWPVKVDPSQIDQILANLCVNARDAISGVGKITIETGNCVVAAGERGRGAEMTPGEYVWLSVSDNGCGMDQETLERIFEPFFTTKGIGKGTGLGLPTVWRSAREHNGGIEVQSEAGSGTSFTLYLPRHALEAAPEPVQSGALEAPRGEETILLVEDEQALLEMAATILTGQGYRVLAASSPGEALELAGKDPGGIALLLTDVIMPDMSGRDLATRLLAGNTRLKCLYMSGYSADVVAHHRVLDEGEHFIQKPFTIPDLATKVREALDRR